MSALTSPSLIQFLQHPKIDATLASIVVDLADVAKDLSRIIARGPLTGGAIGVTNTSNIHNEVQKELDLVANDLLIRKLDVSGNLAGSASEEMEDIRPTPDVSRRGPYLLIFDPLDGSSNIDVNVSIGTIFSILRAPESGRELQLADFLRPGTDQVCAGYFIYGPATQLMLTTGDGVTGFTLDNQTQQFVLSHAKVTIPVSTSEFAINAAYRRHWKKPVATYVDNCLAGDTGVRAKNFNMRWVASLVAEVHRILSRGGVFLYPSDSRPGREQGHLRLLYEAMPMALLIEQAGGKSSTGTASILESVPIALHQRTPLILGASEEVALIESLHRM